MVPRCMGDLRRIRRNNPAVAQHEKKKSAMWFMAAALTGTSGRRLGFGTVDNQT